MLLQGIAYKQFVLTFLCGMQIASKEPEIAEALNTTFKAYPLLVYDEQGVTLDYIHENFTKNQRACAVVAYCQDKLAAAILGLPIEDYPSDLVSAFSNKQKIFYVSDAFVLEAFRGLRLMTVAFNFLEEEIRKKEEYSKLSLATVEREEDHPLKPDNYIPRDQKTWQGCGFKKSPRKRRTETWVTLDESGKTVEAEHILALWKKKLKNKYTSSAEPIKHESEVKTSSHNAYSTGTSGLRSEHHSHQWSTGT